jgi:hypothetical protein
MRERRMETKTAAQLAREHYERQAATIRAAFSPSSREYADLLSAAGREYEAALMEAARSGDASAIKAVKASGLEVK